jgi:hypothetical protein
LFYDYRLRPTIGRQFSRFFQCPIFLKAAVVIANPINATHPNTILAIVTLVSRDKKGKSPENCSLGP